MGISLKSKFMLKIGTTLAVVMIFTLCCYGEMKDQVFAGARPFGMAGAFLAIADDGNAIGWNPAGLPYVERQEIVQVSATARQAFRVTYHERFIGVIRAILEAGIASGELRPLDPHLATWTLLGMIHPYLYPADSEDAELSDEAIEQMATIYLDGVTMPKE